MENVRVRKKDVTSKLPRTATAVRCENKYGSAFICHRCPPKARHECFSLLLRLFLLAVLALKFPSFSKVAVWAT